MSTKQIVGREQIAFANNAQLQAYYEEKYRNGGYKEGGHVVHGVDVSAEYHRRRQQTALRMIAPGRGDTVLDAGCGNGILAAALAPASGTVHAIDIAANALDPMLRAVPNLRFQAMNLEALSFPDETFDKIGCVETLEHLLAPERALTELHRVLKVGGSLVLTYPTVNRTLVKQCGLGRRIPISEHLTEWSYRELTALVEAAHFEIESVEGIAFDFGLLLGLKQVNHFFASSLTRWSLAIRGCPGNSMFVALRLRKSVTAFPARTTRQPTEPTQQLPRAG
jgi:ubiquinone/menaquinone biosynthesis C-methylase UbiE